MWKKYHILQRFEASRQKAFWEIVLEHRIIKTLLEFLFFATCITSIICKIFSNNIICLIISMLISLSLPCFVILTINGFSYQLIYILSHKAKNKFYKANEEKADRIGAKIYSAKELANALKDMYNLQNINYNKKHHKPIHKKSLHSPYLKERIKKLLDYDRGGGKKNDEI